MSRGLLQRSRDYLRAGGCCRGAGITKEPGVVAEETGIANEPVVAEELGVTNEPWAHGGKNPGSLRASKRPEYFKAIRRSLAAVRCSVASYFVISPKTGVF